MRATAMLLAAASAIAADVPFELTVLDADVSYACGVYAVGDIDKDGHNDIVAGADNPRLSWRRFPGFTTHTIAATAAVGFEVHLADVDNDDDLDVLTSGAGITWFENPLPDGNPAADTWTAHTFGSHGTSSSDGSHDFKVGDVNDDSLVDAVERDKERAWHFYLQKAEGGWDTFTVDAVNNTEGTALGDLDGDGDLDITDGLAWFECPADPANETWTRHDLGPNHNQTRVAIGDLNGDQRPDILVGPAEFGGTLTCWYEAPPDPRSGTWEIDTLIVFDDPNFHTLRIGDIDRDGANDIVLGVTGWEGNQSWEPGWRRHVSVFYNAHKDGSAWEEQRWHAERGVWQGVLGDVGSDGDLDLLTCDFRAGGQGELWENKLETVPVASPSLSRPVLCRAALRCPARVFDLRGRRHTGDMRPAPSESGLRIAVGHGAPSRVLILAE
ncbi:MAG: hypothetical protein GF331_21610 [Chitinivibrionales bacterium]|nr:hypothetical protein [Chitinivibrionales bacterium]